MSSRDDWVLAIRLRQLGDVLAALSVLEALKRYRPERRIAYVVEGAYADLLRPFDFIDTLLTPPRTGSGAWLEFYRRLRRLGATSTIDFHGSARSALMTLGSGAHARIGYDVNVRRAAYTIVEPRGEFDDGRLIPRTPIESGMRLARHIGAADAQRIPPRLPVGDDARQRARDLLVKVGVSHRDVDSGAVVGLNPGRIAPVKEWSASRFTEIARRVGAEGGRALVFWGPGEEENARGIVAASGGSAVLAPKTALASMPALLTACAVLVTIDSGLKHLAVCTRVPTVTVFGATDPREWHMGTEKDAVLWRRLSCAPCRRLTCPFGAPCMDIAIESVWRETERVWNTSRRGAAA